MPLVKKNISIVPEQRSYNLGKKKKNGAISTKGGEKCIRFVQNRGGLNAYL